MSEGKLITPDKITSGTIWIDCREPPQFAEKISELVTVPIQIAMLSTGDFASGDSAVERKTINDFCQSIIGKDGAERGRIFSQSERLQQEFKHRYIFVTGTFEECTSFLHPHVILGALARLLVSDIQVVFGLSNEDDFVYLVLKVFEKQGHIKMLPTKPKPKPKKVVEEPTPVNTEIESVFF